MKPPPRKRTKPNRYLMLQRSGPQVCKWQRAEQRMLLNALRKLSQAGTVNDIDYALLRKSIPTRSAAEIQSMVDSLKNKVISSATFKLKRKKKLEEKILKPIEVWTRMASTVAGTLEESITTAFSQMLIVSSTEPCTLNNCDPPQVHTTPTQNNKPADRTVPLRPMPRSVAKDVHPAPPVPSQVSIVTDAQTPPLHPHPAATSPSAAPSFVNQTTSTSTLVNPHTSSSAPGHAPSSTFSTSSTTSKCSSTQPKLQLSTPTAAVFAKFGRTSKHASKDSPRALGVKCVVDFEKIYLYLSTLHKPGSECHLTPMESAVVLDLLMCLPEELPLLDCNKLHKHLIQVYECLSAPAHSSMASKMFEVLKRQKQGADEPHTAGSQESMPAHTETPNIPDSNPKPQQDSSRSNRQLDATDSGGTKLQPDEAKSSHESSNTSSQRGDENMMGLPPLNPFIVPVKLLKRR